MSSPVPADAETAESSGIPGLPPDWPQQATERVVTLVDGVRTKTAGPAIKASRGLVYGLLAGLVGAIMVPVLVVGLIRLLHYFVPGNIYWVYFIMGGLFSLLGLFLWSRRPKVAARA